MTQQADRLSAALAGRYRIERELGQGGMATVYLAADLKHDRKVALKVLKPELAAVLGAERFVVEIKTTASLQHPHILPLFDSGTADGFLFYVMPFIEGETLRDKLNRETQLGVDEAVRIAREVADALDYAHGKGVIHRDIKPENILIQNGRPMVADFGIALAVSAAAGGRMTETGLSLGTPHYMSPEQATADKEISGRSDVYSLASVLYEMLAGQPPHLGGSAQQIIMKIIAEQPQAVTVLRKSVPPNVAAALSKALEKLPADRFESAKAFADALHDPHFTVASTGATAGAHTASRGSWNRMTVAMASLAAIMALVAGWAIATRPDVRPPQVTRTTIELPEQVQIASPTFATRIAISRDGSRIVFEGWRGGPGNDRRLFIRLRDRLQVDSIPGTEGATAPFFSPDGKRIGFFTINPPALKWVSVDGGPVAVVADAEFEGGFGSTPSAGAVWGMDDAIYNRSLDGVMRLPLGGGHGTLASFNDSTAGEKGHTPTDILPNGRGLIIAVPHQPNTMRSRFEIAAVDLRSGKHRPLMRGVYARYVAPGYLVVLRADGALVAAPFDQDRLELTGPPVTIGGGTELASRFQDIAVTDDGTLVHVDQDVVQDLSEIVWVDRDGSTTPVDPAWHANFESVALSPDGRQLATGVLTREGAEVWIAQLPTGPRTKLSAEGEINYRPSWLHDGRVAFRSASTGRFELVAKRADGLGPTERMAADSRSISSGLVSRDGQWRIYRTDATESGRGDILALRAGDSIPVPLVATDAEERYPALSPNGRWLAYRTDEGGTTDVWVRPFPNVSDGRWQISVAGGTEPTWSRTGRELFYLTPANELVAARVTTEPPFAVQDRRVLFTRPSTMALNIATVTYDVSLDDARFLMIRSVGRSRAGSVVADNAGGRLVLVEHWVEELKARVAR